MVALSLPLLAKQERRTSGPILHAAPFGNDDEVLSLNLARGCLHRCAFCSARAHRSYPGDDYLFLYADAPALLEQDLARRKRLPRAVYLCPATDPLPPLFSMQVLTARVVEVLAAHNIEAWLMTRGFIRPTPLSLLERQRDKIRLTIGMTTLERGLQRVLEPLAAPPRLRLRQIAELKRRGWHVQVALEPLIPHVTDTRANLLELLQALAHLGIRQVTAGYMFLRPGIEENVRAALEPLKLERRVLGEYASGPMLKSESVAAARYLPRRYRQRGYASLVALGSELGVNVKVSGVTNPDFLPVRVPPTPPPVRQPLLPMF
ncbi:MAG: radical SAM protein [Gemmataceae bacterium]